MLVRSPAAMGHLVRDARAKHKLTQAALAARIGVSRKWIIDLEAGKRTAELSLVLRTLNALGIELDARPTSRPKGGAVNINAVVDGTRENKR